MRHSGRVLFVAAVMLGSLGLLGPSGCGQDASSSNPRDPVDASEDRRVVVVVPDASSCEIVVDAPQVLPAPHVGRDVPITYNSNPPSSGPHDPVWAAFQEFSTPVPRRNYVHDLEHGAIVFAYNCDKLANGGSDVGDASTGDAGDASTGDACSAIVEQLRAAAASLPDDPICASTGARVRTVITPDPELDVPIAAAAWGWTYRAGCIDRASLENFARKHYGQGPEQLCANGQTHF